jgi:hypothetical protein
MTTVVDPSGTATAIFNRSGVAIVTVAGSGTSQMTATPIPHHCGYTIAIVEAEDTPSVEQAVLLPAGADIGDVVEVHRKLIGGYSARVFAPSGEYLNRNLNGQIDVDAGLTFRKIASGDWRTI